MDRIIPNPWMLACRPKHLCKIVRYQSCLDIVPLGRKRPLLRRYCCRHLNEVSVKHNVKLSYDTLFRLKSYIAQVLPMFLTMPPCEGSVVAHFMKRADAALRI